MLECVAHATICSQSPGTDLLVGGKIAILDYARSNHILPHNQLVLVTVVTASLQHPELGTDAKFLSSSGPKLIVGGKLNIVDYAQLTQLPPPHSTMMAMFITILQ